MTSSHYMTINTLVSLAGVGCIHFYHQAFVVKAMAYCHGGLSWSFYTCLNHSECPKAGSPLSENQKSESRCCRLWGTCLFGKKHPDSRHSADYG